MTAAIIHFPGAGRTKRAILIQPLGSINEDACEAIIVGPTFEEEPSMSICGPLWEVMALAKDNRMGLPIRVHPICEERARRG